MSGKSSTTDPQAKSSDKADRRVRRTVKALHQSFVELFLSRRYDEIQIGDIVEDADVGRSTFYEHFRGKDDLLVASMAHMLDAMADAACTRTETPGVEGIFEHFWENRQQGRYLLAGPPARHALPLLVRELSQRIETRLGDTETTLPTRLAAVRAAESIFAVLRAWMGGEAECPPADLVRGLRGCALD